MSHALKRLWVKVSLYTWHLLRISSALILLVGLGCYIYAVATAPEPPDPKAAETARSVCGRLSGNTFVVPRHYVVFWPEYEGASVWDKNRVHNERGCEAPLVSLPLVMTWPQLQPANQSEYFRDGLKFDGLEVVIAPAPDENFDLRTRLNALLAAAQSQNSERPTYLEASGLYLIERKDQTFPDVINGYYWKEKDGEVDTVFECLGNKGRYGYYNCQATFVLRELKVLVTVGFTSEKLKDWNRIERSVKDFVLFSVEK
ncbi:hypothetical protein VRB78_16015 [Pseudomonas trivialis]|uniref:hypothetical protein n=1 Tax=Pseudomonas trivialis TaxID=200450 RepID=UPI0030D10A9C